MFYMYIIGSINACNYSIALYHTAAVLMNSHPKAVITSEQWRIRSMLCINNSQQTRNGVIRVVNRTYTIRLPVLSWHSRKECAGYKDILSMLDGWGMMVSNYENCYLRQMFNTMHLYTWDELRLLLLLLHVLVDMFNVWAVWYSKSIIFTWNMMTVHVYGA